MERSQFNGATFTEANLAQVNGVGASLIEADFTDAVLIDGEFHNADARQAKFCRSQMTAISFFSAHLDQAHFESVKLTDVDLSDAILEDATFTDVDFHNCCVRGAEFSNVKGLTPDQKQWLKQHGALNVPG